MIKTISEKLQSITKKLLRIYEAGETAGKKSEYDEFWDSYQNKGNRTNYHTAFAGPCWTNDNFRPKYDIILDPNHDNTNSGLSVFAYAQNIRGSLKEILENLGIKFDTQYVRHTTTMFRTTPYMTELPYLDFSSATSVMGTFYDCGASKISVKLPDRDLDYNNFFRTSKLVDLDVTGTIRGTNIDLRYSKSLSKESIIKVIGVLSGETTDMSITFARDAVNKAFETSVGAADGSTSDAWLTLTATRSNWKFFTA